MCGVSVYGFLNGNPVLLLTTWDADGNGCGYNKTTINYPYLYFVAPDVTKLNLTDPLQAFSYSVCVSECPTNSSNPTKCVEPSFFNNSIKFENCSYYPLAI